MPRIKTKEDARLRRKSAFVRIFSEPRKSRAFQYIGA